MIQQSLCWGYPQRKGSRYLGEVSALLCSLFNIIHNAKVWTQPMSLLRDEWIKKASYKYNEILYLLHCIVSNLKNERNFVIGNNMDEPEI